MCLSISGSYLALCSPASAWRQRQSSGEMQNVGSDPPVPKVYQNVAIDSPGKSIEHI